jgi:DNA-binding HxlR family transcriptional regulator
MQTVEVTDVARAARGVEPLEGKWTVQVLCALYEGHARLGELRRHIPPASKKADIEPPPA